MIQNFLYKEIRLCLNPVNYLFLAFSAMIIIPNYPCYVPFFYLCLGTFFLFSNGELAKDMQYSLVLPITKRDMVKARCILVCVYEIAAFVFTVPFAFLAKVIMPKGNSAGIDANVAFYGLVMIPLTLFHIVFFTSFYKRGEKPGKPFLWGCIVFWSAYIVLELPVMFKNLFSKEWGIDLFVMLDSFDKVSQLKQLPVLIVGLCIYIAGWFWTYKASAARFERVDL